MRRASSRSAGRRGDGDVAPARPPASILGRALATGGPATIGTLAAAVADGAIIDSRVLLAHRLGADERAWPPDEDRYASDLLRADDVRGSLARALTRGAAAASVPVLLGAHTLVGPGLPLLARAAVPRGGPRSRGRMTGTV